MDFQTWVTLQSLLNISAQNTLMSFLFTSFQFTVWRISPAPFKFTFSNSLLSINSNSLIYPLLSRGAWKIHIFHNNIYSGIIWINNKGYHQRILAVYQ